MASTPLLSSLFDLVRWGEPWDVEDDPDPLLDEAPFPIAERPISLWA